MTGLDQLENLEGRGTGGNIPKVKAVGIDNLLLCLWFTVIMLEARFRNFNLKSPMAVSPKRRINVNRLTAFVHRSTNPVSPLSLSHHNLAPPPFPRLCIYSNY
jgi:hypothetical protein